MNNWKLKLERLDDFEARSMSNPIHPDAKFSFDLPVKLKVAIADAVTIFSRIETCVLEIVWLMHGADVNQKRKLVSCIVNIDYDLLCK